MAKKFIQKAIKRPGRVRQYVKRLYGNKAFEDNGKGKIKAAYLNKAKAHAEQSGNTSMVHAINLAKTLRKM